MEVAGICDMLLFCVVVFSVLVFCAAEQLKQVLSGTCLTAGWKMADLMSFPP